MKNILYTSSLILIALCIFSFSVSASSVTSLSASFATGDTITITGTGFGTKSPALPILWSDFENGTDGADISTAVVGSFYNTGFQTHYSSTDSYTGSMCAYSHATPASPTSGLVAAWIPNIAKNSFASAKMKLISSAGSVTPHNIKFLRLMAASDAEGDIDVVHGYPNYNIGKERTALSFYGIVNHGLQGAIGYGPNTTLPNPTGWNSVSLWDHLGDLNTQNGWVGFTWGDSLTESAHTLRTYITGSNYAGIREAYFCGYMSNEGYNIDLYLDDVYADSSLARVEIYATNGSYEVQLPLTWSDTSIQIRCNAGQYSPGQAAYLVIRDSNGVASTPYSFSINQGTSDDIVAPAAVSNLAVSSTTSSTAVLTWISVGDDGDTGTASFYDIRYSTSLITSGNFSSATQIGGEPTPKIAGQSETFTVTGLTSSTTYYFAIKTSDEAPNWSTVSNVPSGTTLVATDTTAPSAISTLVVGTRTETTIALTWTSPGDDGATGTATTYDVRYATSLITAANFATATQATGESSPKVAGQSETFTVTDLNAGLTYYFAVKTADEIPNWSAISNVRSGITQSVSDITAPSAISTLAVSSTLETSVVLTWTSVGDDAGTGTATTYDLRYSTSAITSGNFNPATQVIGEPTPKIAGQSETHTVTGLTAGTTYYFAIRAVDEVPNYGAISNVVNTTTLGASSDVTAPSAISTLAVSSTTSSSAILTWTSVGDDAGTGTAILYDIRYSTSPISAGNYISAIEVTGEPTPKIAGESETYTVTDLSPSTTYYFAIKTSDEVPNWSDISNLPNSATLASSDVTAPSAIATLAVGSITRTSIVLTWTATGDDAATGTATTYDIRYSNSNIATDNFDLATQYTSSPTPSIAGITETITITGLVSGTTYYFAIKATDESLNSSTISNVPYGTTLENPTGSCCTTNGTCTETTEPDCSSIWNVWTAGQSCTPNPCAQPGSCCATNGTCTVTTEAFCVGTWTSNGTCTPNICAAPTGSCCNYTFNGYDGTCSVTTEANCGGVWSMFGTCSPNLCPQPTGSCCSTTGTCTVTTSANCTGTWTRYGTCTPNICIQPTGSCCRKTSIFGSQIGTCRVTTQANCGGGIWTISETCTPNPCVQPGACCKYDGSCTITLETDCTWKKSTWTENGICSPNPCTKHLPKVIVKRGSKRGTNPR